MARGISGSIFYAVTHRDTFEQSCRRISDKSEVSRAPFQPRSSPVYRDTRSAISQMGALPPAVSALPSEPAPVFLVLDLVTSPKDSVEDFDGSVNRTVNRAGVSLLAGSSTNEFCFYFLVFYFLLLYFLFFSFLLLFSSFSFSFFPGLLLHYFCVCFTVFSFAFADSQQPRHVHASFSMKDPSILTSSASGYSNSGIALLATTDICSLPLFSCSSGTSIRRHKL